MTKPKPTPPPLYAIPRGIVFTQEPLGDDAVVHPKGAIPKPLNENPGGQSGDTAIREFGKAFRHANRGK